MQSRTDLLPSVPATQRWLLPILLGLITLFSALSPARAAERINVHFFWSAECPHCRDMALSLDAALGGEGDVTLHRHEVSHDASNAELFVRTIERLALPAVVPIVVIGREVMVGHEPGASEKLREMVNRCRAGPCPDMVGIEPPAVGSQTSAPVQNVRQKQASTLRVPWFGEVQISDLSLPALTVVMAAIDGFNPCAMWVLVFLIGLLLGIQDRKRMWLLAGTFLLATAAVYFLFLAAWLNVLLVLGAVLWLRIAIGVLAIGAGGYYLRGAMRSEQVCEVTEPERRRRILDRLRRLVQQPHLAVSMIGVALLAVAVNLVELICSAGIPAVYTGILTQSDLSPAAYYGYLGLYILVFLADDAALVVIAMTTLKMVSTDGGYSRWVRLIGGLVMLALGILLILKPQWLAFG